MKHRWLSILLVLSLLLSLAAPVYAAGPEVPELAPTTEVSGGWEPLTPDSGTNPLYSEDPADAEPDEPAAQASATTPILSATAPTLDAANATYVTVNQAAAQMRDNMVARKTSFTLYINISDYYPGWIAKYFIPLACSESLAVGCTAGDYLTWSWRSYDMTGYKSGTKYELTFTMLYYTTAAQEQQFKTQLQSAFNRLDLSGLTDFGKYAVIYDYVVSHVTYDTAGLAQQEALVKRYRNTYGDAVDANGEKQYEKEINKNWSECRPYFESHSAFAALIKGKAVCQGFGTLFYALCRMAGLPVRMVASDNHGWNLIKLGNNWYNVDATWDNGKIQGQWKTWNYFAKGSKFFSSLASHTRRSEYATSAFLSAYPVPTASYTQPKYFWDLPDGSWYISAIDQAYEKGLMSGITTFAPRFGPDGTTTRAMIVTVLYRMAGEPAVASTHHFSDIPQDAYYAKAVNWAFEKGIVVGVGANLFNPNGNVTRQDAMVMLYNYRTKYLGKAASGSTSLSRFPDANQVAAYGVPALQWAVNNGIISGTSTSTGTYLDPYGYATRAQIAAIFVRYVDKYGKK